MGLDVIRLRLIQLHDEDHMTWRKIANLKEYRGIPAGTLCSVSKGYVPKNLIIRRKLGIPEPEFIEQNRNELGQFT